MELLERWATWQPTAAPFVLDGDAKALLSNAKKVVTHADWASAHRSPDFAQPDDTRLHLGLLPMPFAGDLRRAAVYVLLLNPGLGPHDYFGEHEVPDYNAALRANLCQRRAEGVAPFLFLEPRFGWHGGFDWWHGKFAQVIGRLAQAWSVSFSQARARLAEQVACIELVPYHSKRFSMSSRVLHALESVRIARAFVADYVVPRVKRREAIAIVTRKAAVWNLPDDPGIVVYTGAQSRAAHLTPDSPGGRAILRRLGVTS